MAIHYRALIISLLLRTCFSWTHGTTVDLAWPPVRNQDYITINSTIVGTLNDDFFPCSKVPINPSTPRVLFPVTGGRLQFNLTNTTDLLTYEYIGSIYIGQFSGDTTPARNASEYITTYVWENYSSGPDCGEKVNLTQHVNEAFDREDMSELDIVGMNATVAIRNVLFSTDPYYDYPADVYNVEEMYQCGYITIGPPGLDTQEGDWCNSEEGVAALASMSSASVAATATTSPLQTPASTSAVAGSSSATRMPPPTDKPLDPSSTLSNTAIRTYPSATASSSSTVISLPTVAATNPDPSAPRTRNIGIGVGVSVGTSTVLLVIGVLLFLRRRKAKGTIGPDFLVSREEREGTEKKGRVVMKGKPGEDEEGPGGADSVQEEPLPVYTERKAW